MKKHAYDMVGKKCGALTVLARKGSDPQGRATWECECECGNKTVVRGDQLRFSFTRSCGCHQGFHGKKSAYALKAVTLRKMKTKIGRGKRPE